MTARTRQRDLALARRLGAAALALIAAGCSGAADGAAKVGSSPTLPDPASRACELVDVRQITKLASGSYGPPQSSGVSGWITTQCTWVSTNGAPTVSIAVGSAATLKAAGFAGTVADFLTKRHDEDAKRLGLGPIDGIGADAGYITSSPAPMVVGYRRDVLLQVLTVNPKGGAVERTVTLELARAALKRIG